LDFKLIGEEKSEEIDRRAGRALEGRKEKRDKARLLRTSLFYPKLRAWAGTVWLEPTPFTCHDNVKGN
jgi:hypothetical protein